MSMTDFIRTPAGKKFLSDIHNISCELTDIRRELTRMTNHVDPPSKKDADPFIPASVPLNKP